MPLFRPDRRKPLPRRGKPMLEALETRTVPSGNPPTANPDFATTDEATARDIDVVSNDTDPEMDVLTVSTFDATSTRGASITLNPDGTLHYDPSGSSALNALAAGEPAIDTFSYTVSDGTSTSTTTVTVTVTGLNDPPTATNDTASTDEDTATDINVLSNDTDPDVDGNAPDDTLTVSTFDATSTLGATISLNADGTLRYNPSASSTLNALAAGATAMDTFNYTISDGNGGTSSAMVTVTVTGVNDAPSAVNDTGTANEHGPAISVDLTANDTDPDTGDVLQIQSIDATGTLGTVTINADNHSVTYNPNGQFESLQAGQTATDTFHYTVNDGHGGTSTATVTITINGQNDPPVFTSPSTASVAENTTAVLTVAATDPEMHTVTYSISGGADGTLFNIDPNTGALTFKTAPNFEAPADADTNNQYVVTVGASDGTDTSAQTITVTVTNVNEPPVNTVPAASQSVFRNGTLLFRASSNNALRVTDVDAGTSPIKVELRVTSGRLKLGATNGVTVTGDNTGVVTLTGTVTAINTALEGTRFTPVAGFTGTATLTMTTNDQGNTGSGGALQDADTVTIRVGNRPPTALTNSAFHATLVSRPAQLRRLNVPASAGLLSHVTDADGDRLTIQLLSRPRVGSLVVGTNGAFSYTPPFGFTGRVTFTYRVSDGLSFSAPITVTIDVLLPVAPWRRRALPS